MAYGHHPTEALQAIHDPTLFNRRIQDHRPCTWEICYYRYVYLLTEFFKDGLITRFSLAAVTCTPEPVAAGAASVMICCCC